MITYLHMAGNESLDTLWVLVYLVLLQGALFHKMLCEVVIVPTKHANLVQYVINLRKALLDELLSVLWLFKNSGLLIGQNCNWASIHSHFN